MDGNIGPELVTIHQFGNMSEALLAKGCLESAGIECFLTDLNIARLEWPLSQGTRLQVNPDDAQSAIAVLEGSAIEDYPADSVDG